MSRVKIDCQTAARSRTIGRRVADDVVEDVVERAADLEERGEQVRHFAIGDHGDPSGLQQALDVPAEPAVERRRPPAVAARVDQAVEVVVVAGEEQIDDDVLVELQVLGTRASAPSVSLAPSRSRSASARSPERVRRWAAARDAPEACQRVPPGDEVAPSACRSYVDPLGQERVAVRQARDCFAPASDLGPSECHKCAFTVQASDHWMSMHA